MAGPLIGGLFTTYLSWRWVFAGEVLVVLAILGLTRRIADTGEEVDLVLERDDGQVIAVEIKAGSRISGEDFRGLRRLKERLGTRLEEAVVLHTGEHAYKNDDWITVLPLDQLWASTEGQTQP